MSTTYEITSIDFDKKRIYFLVKTNNKMRRVFIDLGDKDEIYQYEGVNKDCHYRDEYGDIVAFREGSCRLVLVDDDKVFIKARQWEYDRWMLKKYPNSVNARVYSCMTNKNFKLTVV